MNKNKKTDTIKTLILCAFLAIAAVGCSNPAKDAVTALLPGPIDPGNGGQDGQADGSDQSKKIEFKVWKELIGNYQLTQFNGQAVATRFSQIEESKRDFYDRTDKKYLESVIFPLYASVSSGSDMAYNFGPIDQKGVTTLTDNGSVKIYTYKFDGPIYYAGYDIEMHLDMNVVKEGNNLYVTYKLSVPGKISEISHNFTLQAQ